MFRYIVIKSGCTVWLCNTCRSPVVSVLPSIRISSLCPQQQYTVTPARCWMTSYQQQNTDIRQDAVLRGRVVGVVVGQG